MHDKWKHHTMVRGTKIHNAKLTEEQVLAIFKDHRSASETARAYAVSKSAVCFIRDGRNWGWVTGKSPPAYKANV